MEKKSSIAFIKHSTFLKNSLTNEGKCCLPVFISRKESQGTYNNNYNFIGIYPTSE